MDSSDPKSDNVPGYMKMTTSALLKRRSRRIERLSSFSWGARRFTGGASRKFLGKFVMTEKVKAAKIRAQGPNNPSTSKHPNKDEKKKRSKRSKVSKGKSFKYSSLLRSLAVIEIGADAKHTAGSSSINSLDHLPSISEIQVNESQLDSGLTGETMVESLANEQRADPVLRETKSENARDAVLADRDWAKDCENGSSAKYETCSEPSHSFGGARLNSSGGLDRRSDKRVPNRLGQPQFLELVTPYDKTEVDCEVDPIDPIIRFFNKVLNTSRVRKNKKGANVIGRWMSSSGKWRRIAMVMEDT